VEGTVSDTLGQEAPDAVFQSAFPSKSVRPPTTPSIELTTPSATITAIVRDGPSTVMIDRGVVVPDYVAAGLRWPLPPRADETLLAEAASFLRSAKVEIACDPGLALALRHLSAADLSASNLISLSCTLGESVGAVKTRALSRFGLEVHKLRLTSLDGAVLLDPLSLSDFVGFAATAAKGEPITVTGQVSIVLLEHASHFSCYILCFA
jgi:hypothetical protein